MKLLIEQLENSLNSGNYFLSLFTALSFPDIAGAMDSENGQADSSKYKAWYEKWVRPRFVDNLMQSCPAHAREYIKNMENPLDGESCYFFRCSMLHQGRTVHPKNTFERIIFIEPRSTTNKFHYVLMNKALCIDLVDFCKEVIAGAKMWMESVEGTEQYKINYQNFAKRHETGLKPYIVGVPVIG